ncbi:MAG TPA: hypothetical protein VIS75_02840 [Chitinophagaceae bacterium]
MKSIGSLLFILGAAASIFGLMDRDLIVLSWIKQWGQNTAWVIKIGFMILGAALFMMGARKKADQNNAE